MLKTRLRIRMSDNNNNSSSTTTNTSSSNEPSKLDIALLYKDEGNAFFKDQNYKKALVSYGKGLAYVRGLKGKRSKMMMSTLMPMYNDDNNNDSISDDDDNKAMLLEAILDTNVGVCYTKLGEPRKALEYYDKATTVDTTYWKALLRKSEAYLQLNLFSQAKNTLSSINTNTLKPEDIKAIDALMVKITKSERIDDKKSGSAFKGIFNKL